MRPRDHVIFGLLISVAIAFLFDLSLASFAVMFAASVLIDLDHVSRYILKTGDLSPRKFFAYYDKEGAEWKAMSKRQQTQYKYPFFMFHGVETLLLLLVLGAIYSSAFFFVFIGFSIHLLLDYANYFHHGIPLGIKTSAVYVLVRNRGKRDV